MTPSDTSDHRWTIPITYTVSHNKNFENTTVTNWFYDDLDDLRIPDVLHTDDCWVILNVQETGTVQTPNPQLLEKLRSTPTAKYWCDVKVVMLQGTTG